MCCVVCVYVYMYACISEVSAFFSMHHYKIIFSEYEKKHQCEDVTFLPINVCLIGLKVIA